MKKKKIIGFEHIAQGAFSGGCYLDEETDELIFYTSDDVKRMPNVARTRQHLPKINLPEGRGFQRMDEKIKGLTKEEYFKAYREANKDKIKAHHKAYREANKDKIAERAKAYYEANKDKIKAYKKAYSEANKDKIAERVRNTHVYIPLLGGRGGKSSVYTNGVTKEIKEQLPKIVNKVLDDCIRNPSKFLDDEDVKP